MIPKTIVEHDQSGIEMILNALENLLKERYIEGIRTKHRTIHEIEQMAEMVKIYQHRINVESNAITRFSETFIRQFATDNNKCFETTEVLFKKVKSTIASLKKVFHKTTEIDRRQLPEGVEAPSVFKKSALGDGEYSPDCFGFESFPEPVKDLYNALETLFASATAVLALCHQIIAIEEETRNDIVMLRQIYKDSCEELYGAVRAATSFFINTDNLPINELEERRKKAGSDDNEQFLKEAYHTVDKKVMTQYLILKEIREAQNKGLTPVEASFWKGDCEKAFMVRLVIEKFDLVERVVGQKGRLESTAIVEFLKWCGVPKNEEKRLYEKLFTPIYKKNGKYIVLGWTAIDTKRKLLKDCGDTEEKLASDFEKRIENIFSLENDEEGRMII